MKKKAILLMLFLMFISTNALSQNIIHGKISGDVQEGISVELYKTSCGGDTLVDTFITNSEGYYAFGCLDDGEYKVVPDNVNYTFTPEFDSVQIPQTIIQSYDFTSIDICGGTSETGRFLDNSDGTATDCKTNVVWLRNANCFGLQDWNTAVSSAEGLNSGECGLIDGSAEGDWRLPTKSELQGIGTNPPVTWVSGYPPATWARPGNPFSSVESYYYWSSTEYDSFEAWDVGMVDGLTGIGSINSSLLLVWLVRDAN